MRDILNVTSGMDFNTPPPAVAQFIHRRIREVVGHDDPYRDAKDRVNKMALELLPELKRQVQSAADPLDLAIRLAIAGNVIDLGVHGYIDKEDLRNEIDRAMHEPAAVDLETFRDAVTSSKKILYIADNAGEIVFDRLLIEQISFRTITVAVRGGPVLNDATMSDARTAGLHEVVQIVDTGSDAPGILLDDCSKEFRSVFDESDCIIAKGQGNYESLSGTAKNTFYLLKVKCSVIASRTGRRIGTHLLTSETRRQSELTI